jgi:hypothetical protein
MNEYVSAAHLPKEHPLCCGIEEFHIVPGSSISSPEQDSRQKVTNQEVTGERPGWTAGAAVDQRRSTRENGFPGGC